MGITLLQGGEELLADRAIAQVLERRKGSVINSFEAGDLEVGVITDALAPSLFGEERTVVIKNLQDLITETSDELLEALNIPDESLELVFWHKGGVKGKGLGHYGED